MTQAGQTAGATQESVGHTRSFAHPAQYRVRYRLLGPPSDPGTVVGATGQTNRSA